MDQASLLLRKQLKGVLGETTYLQWTIYAKTPSLCSSTDSLLITDLTKRPVEGFSAGLVDDSSLFEWAVTIMGPPDTL